MTAGQADGSPRDKAQKNLSLTSKRNLDPAADPAETYIATETTNTVCGTGDDLSVLVRGIWSFRAGTNPTYTAYHPYTSTYISRIQSQQCTTIQLTVSELVIEESPRDVAPVGPVVSAIVILTPLGYCDLRNDYVEVAPEV